MPHSGAMAAINDAVQPNRCASRKVPPGSNDATQ